MEDAEGDEPGPVSPLQAAQRIIALTAVLVRVDVEHHRARDPGGARRAYDQLAGWVEQQRIGPMLSPAETRIVARTAVGDLDARALFELSWRWQAVAALVWAVDLSPAMTPYHQPTAPEALRPLLPMLRPVAPFIAAANLRADQEIARERDRAELWHWRARTERLRRQGLRPPWASLAEIIRSSAQSAVAQGLIEAARDGDFDCGGVAYAGSAHWPDAASTAVERHLALNWLCDGGPWDEVRTDT